MNNGRKTFRVVPRSYAKYLKVSAEITTDEEAKSKFEEDLNNMLDFDGDERVSNIGSFDMTLYSSAPKSTSVMKSNNDSQQERRCAPIDEPHCSSQHLLKLPSDDDSTVSSADSDFDYIPKKK